MLRKVSIFMLELTGYLVLCGILAILMGAPALWASVGMFVVFDVAVILYLSRVGFPPAIKRVRIPHECVSSLLSRNPR